MLPFELLSPKIKELLLKLEKKDKIERNSYVDRSRRLRQIPRETGEFLFQFLSIYAPRFSFLGLEIGTSAGYSAIWQGLALEMNGQGTLISLENDPDKYNEALENIKTAEITENVKLIQADAKNYLKNLSQVNLNYIFLDAEKEDYLDYYNLIRDRMVSGSVLIADNVISHASVMHEFLEKIKLDEKVVMTILPIGKGLALLKWL